MRATSIWTVLLVLLLIGRVGMVHAQVGSLRLTDFDPRIPAPDFAATSLSGETLSLLSLRGRHVLVNFWATWCPPCLEEMPSLEALAQQFESHELTVVAISSDEGGAATVAPFIEKLQLTFPILLDPDTKVAGSYGAKNLPMTVLIDPQGRVTAAALGARDWGSSRAVEQLRQRMKPL
jgi:peroxiredoxin